METFDRYNEKGKSGTRIIEVNKCWDCPFADFSRGLGFGFFVTCKLTDKDYHFDDNGIHFSTPHDCPLELREDYLKENERA